MTTYIMAGIAAILVGLWDHGLLQYKIEREHIDLFIVVALAIAGIYLMWLTAFLPQLTAIVGLGAGAFIVTLCDEGILKPYFMVSTNSPKNTP